MKLKINWKSIIEVIISLIILLWLALPVYSIYITGMYGTATEDLSYYGLSKILGSGPGGSLSMVFTFFHWLPVLLLVLMIVFNFIHRSPVLSFFAVTFLAGTIYMFPALSAVMNDSQMVIGLNFLSYPMILLIIICSIPSIFCLGLNYRMHPYFMKINGLWLCISLISSLIINILLSYKGYAAINNNLFFIICGILLSGSFLLIPVPLFGLGMLFSKLKKQKEDETAVPEETSIDGGFFSKIRYEVVMPAIGGILLVCAVIIILVTADKKQEITEVDTVEEVVREDTGEVSEEEDFQFSAKAYDYADESEIDQEEQPVAATVTDIRWGYNYLLHGALNGKYAIEMTLQENTEEQNNVRGWYSYVKGGNGAQIDLLGSLEGTRLVLHEYYDGKQTGTFEGVFSNNKYAGTWTSTVKEGKTMPFSVEIKNVEAWEN
jgi:membrane protein